MNETDNNTQQYLLAVVLRIIPAWHISAQFGAL